MKKIVIVGGGAGGLELATFLGNKLGRKRKASVTLIDRNQTHLWKPLLHEVATGSLDDGVDAL
ncbi:FAD-dependent oxidoreductase, partial [Streptomyces sp. P9(2023)]|uniref:FAD-dependent oxidoreductase n=1 Tax=Streptomyces sp. P9(2023) TaxID=3064394 RepID=UPI0028F3FD8B